MSLEVTLAVLVAALLHASWNAMIKGGKACPMGMDHHDHKDQGKGKKHKK